MSRVEELTWLRDLTHESIEDAPIDKRAPLIAQHRAILAELEALGVGAVEPERNGLVDFQAELAKRRQSTSSRQSRAKVPIDRR